MNKQQIANLILILALLAIPTFAGAQNAPQSPDSPLATPTPGPSYSVGVSVLYPNTGNGVGEGLTLFAYNKYNGIWAETTDTSSHIVYQLEVGTYRFHMSFWNAFGYWDCAKDNYVLDADSIKELVIYCRRPSLIFLPLTNR